MLNIKCPYCGDRSQKEFAYGGDGTITRPKLNQEISDEEWDNFVYLRKTPGVSLFPKTIGLSIDPVDSNTSFALIYQSLCLGVYLVFFSK